MVESIPPVAPATAGRLPAWAELTLCDTRAPLDLDTEANAASATWLRRGFRAWLTLDVTGDLAEDLVLAVYEAIANAAEHAYINHPGETGPVRLRAHRFTGAVAVRIADDGTWRTTPSGEHRSRGLHLIHHLIPHTHLERTPTGTVIHLHTPVPPPADEPPAT